MAIAGDDAIPLRRFYLELSQIGMYGGNDNAAFRSQFHCAVIPQWVFILGGQMEIGLQGGASRVFRAGEHFYAADMLPTGATFDPQIHGHWSRQVGADPLVTLFVRG